MKRMTIAGVAAAFAISPVLAVAPAQADTAAKALPKRTVTEKLEKVGSKLIFSGRVKGSPVYGGKKVIIQRKWCKSASAKTCMSSKRGFDKVKTIRTNRNAYYRTSVGAPRNGVWRWRAVVPKTARYATSKSAGAYYTYSI